MWAAVLIGTFASWALRDAPAHGKPRSIALVFTAAWLLVYFLAVFPYLFATRGIKGGAVASLKLVLLYGVLGIAWITASRLM